MEAGKDALRFLIRGATPPTPPPDLANGADGGPSKVRIVWVSFDSIGRDCLRAAISAGANAVGIVTLTGPTQPERAGQVAFEGISRELGAKLILASNINSEECLDAIRRLEPEMIFVVGWSQLVGQEIIDAAPKGVFGMHPTLLPRHRGRAPIPWAILSGLTKTGVTLFEIEDPTADSGRIVGQVEVPIDARETATTLYEKIADAHVELVREFMPKLMDGTAPRQPQDARRASAWPKRTPDDGIIDWETRASYLYDWIRAQTRPYPGAFTFAGDSRVIVWRARVVSGGTSAPAGTILEHVPDGYVVACGEGLLMLEEVQVHGQSLGDRALREFLTVGTRLG
jgi:methionyl-tRNA formyltransferase